MIFQKEIKLPLYRRGYHLITNIIEKELIELPQHGLLHIFVKHTSAGITINENIDPTVRVDLELAIDNLVPEEQPYYSHTIEGTDDMPAHIKSSILGPAITIPITNKKMNIGIWQGIYFCEFRNRPKERNLVLTIYS